MDTPQRSFRILETLGKGGFGAVYRAEVVGGGGFTKQVAVKVLKKDSEEAEQMALRLRDEARMLGLIQHRAVVGVDDLIQLKDGWAVIMEYVPGVDITLLIDSAPTQPRVALEIIEEVASALHAAYAVPSEVTGKPLRLLHRDIKPANIRITAQGLTKLLDFGVARAEFDQREAATASVLLGTMKYMAPERWDNLDGPGSDIFALGFVLAEMLAGQTIGKAPLHSARYSDWLYETIDLAWTGMSKCHTGTLNAQGQTVMALLSEMLAYEHTSRPSAREVERRCRKARDGLRGPMLRDWAEEKVPELLAKYPRPKESSPSVETLVALELERPRSDAGALGQELSRAAGPASGPAHALGDNPRANEALKLSRRRGLQLKLMWVVVLMLLGVMVLGGAAAGLALLKAYLGGPSEAELGGDGAELAEEQEPPSEEELLGNTAAQTRELADEEAPADDTPGKSSSQASSPHGSSSSTPARESAGSSEGSNESQTVVVTLPSSSSGAEAVNPFGSSGASMDLTTTTGAPEPQYTVVATTPSTQTTTQAERTNTGSFKVIGDEVRVVLSLGASTYNATKPMPPGTYKAVAYFTASPVPFGNVTIAAGSTATIECFRSMQMCRVK